MIDDPFERGRQNARDQINQTKMKNIRESELRQKLREYFSDSSYQFSQNSFAPQITYRDPVGREVEFSAYSTLDGQYEVHSTFHPRTTCASVDEVVELAGEFFERTHKKLLQTSR